MLGQQAFGFGSNGDITGGTVNAASNGLSLSGATTVVLGQDVGAVGNPAALTSDREIPSSNFSLTFLNADGYTKIFSTLIRVKADLPIMQLLDDTESLSLQLERRDTDGRIVYGSSGDNNLLFFDTGNAKVSGSNTTDLSSKFQVSGNGISLQNTVNNSPFVKFHGSVSANDMFIQGTNGALSFYNDSALASMDYDNGGTLTITERFNSIANLILAVDDSSHDITISNSDSVLGFGSPVINSSFQWQLIRGVAFYNQVVSGSTDNADSTLTVSNDLSTYNTTAGVITATAGTFDSLATRSAGANNLTNVGLSARASGAQLNYAALFPTGSVGVNFATPTARLHIGAGTATAGTAPLKFTSGTLLSSAESGAMEFLTDNVYITITTGTARKEFTLNDITLTSTRVPIATTNGRLTDLSTFTYGSGRLSPNYITLAAGATGANTAPLKFTSGTNNTTAEAGAMEYNGTNLFFTRTGTTRENIICASAVTTEVIVSDTSLTINFEGTTYKLLARA